MLEPSLFAGIDPRLPSPTAAHRKHLRALEASRPLGMTRVRNGWRSPNGFVPLAEASALCRAGWARKDYQGRNPRLIITRLGRETQERC